MAIEPWRPRGSMARRPWRDVDDLFSRFFDDWLSPRLGGATGFTPALDMVDRDSEILVRADLPGLEQKDLHVNVENGVLTIRGSREEQREEGKQEEGEYYCCERWSGAFVRSVTLPPGVDTEKIQATFRNGVLEIRVPKTRQAAGKKIEIKAA